jgi:hypothetical protein
MLVAVVMPDTWTGVSVELFEPFPIWPLPPVPHAHTVPSDFNKAANELPPSIAGDATPVRLIAIFPLTTAVCDCVPFVNPPPVVDATGDVLVADASVNV